MQGHSLMQAIARVNRVFKDKPGGLVVDYLGLADQLRKALAAYTESGGKGKPTFDQAEAVAVMLEKYEICCAMFHGFDYQQLLTASPGKRMAGVLAAMEHVIAQQDEKARFLQVVTELSKAFALSVPHDDALRIRDEVAFFQTVRAGLVKSTPPVGKTKEDLDAAIRQIVSKAMASDEVVDIFAAAGLKKPDISILSDEFLEDVRRLPYRNLAAELLQKLLSDEIKVRQRKYLVQSREFSQMLAEAIRNYQNRSIEAAQVITQLIDLAKQMREAQRRGEDLGLSDDELAFYDALEVNDSAVKVLGDENLRIIARELVETVRQNVTIDWAVKEAAQAKLRTMVKRILRKHGYPPDKQEKATRTVLEQAELLGWEVAA
jgi:type I restriction enzyme R subunit